MTDISGSLPSEAREKGLRLLRFSYGMEGANTYAVISGSKAIVIDACSEDDADELERLEIQPTCLIMTHEHADHIWGLNAFRRKFPNMEVIASRRLSDALGDPNKNMAAYYRIYAAIRFGEGYDNQYALNRSYVCDPADKTFDDRLAMRWQDMEITVFSTPGHSPGSCMIFFGRDMIFSGDTMLNDETFLRFKGGDEGEFRQIALPVIDSIDQDAVIFPGHGEAFLKKDWKKTETWETC